MDNQLFLIKRHTAIYANISTHCTFMCLYALSKTVYRGEEKHNEKEYDSLFVSAFRYQ